MKNQTSKNQQASYSQTPIVAQAQPDKPAMDFKMVNEETNEKKNEKKDEKNLSDQEIADAVGTAFYQPKENDIVNTFLLQLAKKKVRHYLSLDYSLSTTGEDIVSMFKMLTGTCSGDAVYMLRNHPKKIEHQFKQEVKSGNELYYVVRRMFMEKVALRVVHHTDKFQLVGGFPKKYIREEINAVLDSEKAFGLNSEKKFDKKSERILKLRSLPVQIAGVELHKNKFVLTVDVPVNVAPLIGKKDMEEHYKKEIINGINFSNKPYEDDFMKNQPFKMPDKTIVQCIAAMKKPKNQQATNRGQKKSKNH